MPIYNTIWKVNFILNGKSFDSVKLPFWWSSWLRQFFLTAPAQIRLPVRSSSTGVCVGRSITANRGRVSRMTRQNTGIYICVANEWAACGDAGRCLARVEMWGRPSKRLKLINCLSYFKINLTNLENPVCPAQWLWAEGLSITGLYFSDLFDPSELSDVVLELNPVHRPISEFRFRNKPPTSPPDL